MSADRKPTLLVLAAGMGSRYGKLKQMDGFGPNHETIIEYSIYDAIQAGFGKVVFIIREWFRADFETYFRQRLGDAIELVFVNQELDDLPITYDVDPKREKPWGTAHAVWVARNVISEPFGVINADDYYGVAAFKQLHDFLTDINAKDDYAVIAYYLRNTLSEHGTVNRGVCKADDEGYLDTVIERTKIGKNLDGTISFPDSENGRGFLSENTLVSMNMWGFQSNYFTYAANEFGKFLETYGNELSSEYYIPTLIDFLIHNNIVKVRIIDTESDWFGVTYQEDKPAVQAKITALIENGVYPQNLWS
ncbi:MAG: sugar phosphate nucleotidyltransferase [Saprospiraceae bacterium]